MFYGFAPMIAGLFTLDLEHEKVVYNINAKCLKKTDNTTCMWHYRLGHTGKKRMQKLHKDGVLTSFDCESFETCKACLMVK